MQSGKCGENLTWTLDGGILTISGNGKMGNYGWTKKYPWNRQRNMVKKIVIEYGVTTIAYCAFEDCVSLKEIEIPNSVEMIDGSAFSNCKSLIYIKIPEGIETIYPFTFSLCYSLRAIEFPKSIKNIWSWAFAYCKSLKEVIIPVSVKDISKDIFKGCECLEKIYFPAGRGFEKALSYGNNAKLIPYDTATPQDAKTTPKPVKERKFFPVIEPIPVVEQLRWTFAVKTLTVGGVREIKCYPYDDIPWIDNLNKIQKIVIEDGVEEIAANAFSECTRLEQVIIPASVKTIGDFAFTSCYCGERTVNNGKNVIWSLDSGILMIKKNPDAKSDADFSTGYEMWNVADKNIKGVKIERGVIPSKQFFNWLAKMGDNVSVQIA